MENKERTFNELGEEVLGLRRRDDIFELWRDIQCMNMRTTILFWIIKMKRFDVDIDEIMKLDYYEIQPVYKIYEKEYLEWLQKAEN